MTGRKAKATEYLPYIAAILVACASTMAAGRLLEKQGSQAGITSWLLFSACVSIVAVISFRAGKMAATGPGSSATLEREEKDTADKLGLEVARAPLARPEGNPEAKGGKYIAGSEEIYEVATQINEIADRLMEEIGSFKV